MVGMDKQATSPLGIFAGGLFALFTALLVAALTVFGIISMILGHMFMLAAAIVGMAIIWTEVFPAKKPKHKFVSSLILVLVFGIADYAIVKHKERESEAMKPIQTEPSVPATALPIIQKSKDSPCSNISAGGSVNIDCYTGSGHNAQHKPRSH